MFMSENPPNNMDESTSYTLVEITLNIASFKRTENDNDRAGTVQRDNES